MLAQSHITGFGAVDLDVELRVIEGLCDLNVGGPGNGPDDVDNLLGRVAALGKRSGRDLDLDRRGRALVQCRVDETAADYDAVIGYWAIGGNEDDLAFFTSDASVTNVMTAQGQLQLPVVGSGAGVLIGGDTQLYRSAADVLTTPDDVEIGEYLYHLGDADTYLRFQADQITNANTRTITMADRDLDLAAPVFDSITGGAQVTFPSAVLVFVSNDGKQYRLLCDVLTECPPQTKSLNHRFVADGLKGWGRHVRVYALPVESPDSPTALPK